jgi:hypothetical protein
MNDFEKVKLIERLGKANLKAVNMDHFHPRFSKLIESLK